VNCVLPTIINDSTFNGRKLRIFSTLHLQNSALILVPFSSVLRGTSKPQGVRMMKYLLLACALCTASSSHLPRYISASGQGKQLGLSFK